MHFELNDCQCVPFFSLGAPLAVVLRAPPPLLKAVALLVTLVNAVFIPLQFDPTTPVKNVVIFFLVGWLASFKILGCALGRGPLCSDELTVVGTFITYVLPINPLPTDSNKRAHTDLTTNVNLNKAMPSSLGYTWDAARHLLLLVVTTSLSQRLQRLPYGPTGFVHMLGSDLLDALNLYAFIGIIMNVASIGTIHAGQRLLGFSAIMPHCDRPWLAASVGEFWSRRWNINTGEAIRYLVYDPIVEGSMTKINKPNTKKVNQSEEGATRRRCSDARRVVALAAAFATSGLVHELFIYQLRGRPSGHGRWFLFFFLQAPLIVLVDPWLKKLEKSSPWAARAATIGGQLLLAHYLFFMPVVELGIVEDIHGGVNHGIRMFLSDWWFSWLYPHSVSNGK